jgi:hypothetical protein
MSQQKLMFKGGALMLGGAATAAGIIGMLNGWSQACTGTSDEDKVAKGARDVGLAFNGVQAGVAGIWTLGLLWVFMKGDGKINHTLRFYVIAAILTGLALFTFLTTNVRAAGVDDSCKPGETLATITTITSISAFVGAGLIGGDLLLALKK